MSRLLSALLLFFYCNSLYGQLLQDRLDAWSEKNPVEKLYLHTDREWYTAGQTVWFKGYFLSGYLPSLQSTSIYVELLDADGKLISREVFPVFMSQSTGQLELPENLASGNYLLRAYSPIMLNQRDFLFTKHISVYGNKINPVHKQEGTIYVSFFPEGGNLVAGLVNNVAFKATLANGLPADVGLQIRNHAGQLITEVHSIHDGMGTFQLTPEPDTFYNALLHGDSGKSYILPKPITQGVALKLSHSQRGIHFRMEQQGSNTIFRPAYIIGQMQNRSVFRLDLKSARAVVTGLIQTRSLPSGILQITVFNAEDVPLAERLVFVNNKEYILPAQIVADSFSTAKKMLNQFTLKLQDTVSGYFSVSVTDADYEGILPRPQNIYSWFLLSSDINGYVHRPSWYFTQSGDSVEQALDLVMLTNGWRRFSWSDVNNNTLPVATVKDNGFIRLSGRATLEGQQKPLVGQELLLLISPADTTVFRRPYSQIVQTDAQGYFTADSLVFYDRSKLFLSDIKGNKSKSIQIKLDGDSLMRSYPLHEQSSPGVLNATEAAKAAMASAYKETLSGMLENVTVTGRVKIQLDEYYTHGLFARGRMARTINLTDEPNGSSMNIMDYLPGRVPGISVIRQDTYHIFYRKPVTMQVIKPVMSEVATPNSFGNATPNEMALFLDEMPVDADFLSTIPLNDIAYVKIFPTFSGAPGGGADGTLAVYLKKGRDIYKDMKTDTDVIYYRGYSVMKEFYSPDYRVKPEIERDTRLTLLWEPGILINNINPTLSVRFYNNDRARGFKIVAEGITTDGKLLMVEKVLE